jgi:taurine dioxygenase
MLITPLPQGFGAEVSDFDLPHGRAAKDVARLQRAYEEWHLLIFRAAEPVAPERQVEIAGWFGPVLAEGTPWTVLDNAEPAGRDVLPFHSDITFLEFPLAGISLCPQELPENGTSTTYISNAVGWQALPENLQRELQGLKARHFYDSSHDMGFDWPVFEYWHPACMAHAKTGQPLLFVTEHHVDRIEGMSEARCAEVLPQLFAALYAPVRRYEHVWRKGDLVVWDNMAVQHARTRIAAPSQGRRVMRRVQLGQMSFLAQVERARQRQASLAG